MDLSIKFDTVKSGRSILYIEIMITKTNIVFLSLNLGRSSGPHEVPHNATFHLVSSLFAKVPI